ncbi:MFS transporter [Salinibacterium xinjiangense]|uniref:Predicted arabinose efflux permease, MFS family n=2 Tax=Salinibacterium xinjiangense TaxID=386302 RepID=A0A2C8ZI75_9MICO|nr:MFS transporter [Salinibacterium xinjiangense]SOE64496.1 Predicted arabinose efflux permease, MFS family [Salinibacterium xinjiangense]
MVTMTPDQVPATMPIAVAIQRPAWRDTFSALKVHNYRLYIIAQFISNTAGWAQRIAVDWLVLEITGSVTLVGLTIALQFLPTLILGAYAGVIADRYKKRSVLIFCQLIIAALNLVLAIIAISGNANLLVVYALVLAVGTLQVFDGPARAVFVNEMVGPRHIRNAISVNASIFHLGALIGPALSGVLIVAVGSGWAIGANVVAGLIGVILLLFMRTRDLLVGARAPTHKGQIREAGRYILSKPTLFWTLVMVTFVAIFGMPMPALLAGMADQVYLTGATGYGLYNSLAAIGALLGALASARRATLRLRTIMIGAIIYGLMLITAGLAPFYPMFLLLLPAIGLSRLLYTTASETMMQLSSNLAIRGRIMAFWVMVLVGGQAIGGPVMGWFAENLGAKTAMVISGAVPATAAITIAILLSRSGKLRVAVAAKRGKWIAIVPKRRATTRPAG